MYESGIAILEERAKEAKKRADEAIKELEDIQKSILRLRESRRKSPQRILTPEAVGGTHAGHIVALVSTAINSFSGPFTVHDIESQIRESNPGIDISRKSISTKLSKFRSRKKPIIRALQRGSGNVPARYLKI